MTPSQDLSWISDVAGDSVPDVQTASLAINVIAPVGSHCTHKPRAFAETSSNHSSIWVRGLSTREKGRHDDGWMDGLKDFNYNC